MGRSSSATYAAYNPPKSSAEYSDQLSTAVPPLLESYEDQSPMSRVYVATPTEPQEGLSPEVNGVRGEVSDLNDLRSSNNAPQVAPSCIS